MNVVYLDDDTFLLKPKSWFEKFSSLYKDKVNVPFSCNIRANLVDEEIISILREAGLDSAWMGVECGNEEDIELPAGWKCSKCGFPKE